MTVYDPVYEMVKPPVASSVVGDVTDGGVFDPLSLSSPAFVIPFTEGSGQIAYNLAGSHTSGDSNLFVGPENLSQWALKGGTATWTDRYADFETGDSAATRLNMNAGASCGFGNSVTLPAGQAVTMSFYAKATTGSSTAFRTFRSGLFVSHTATDVWQRFSLTFTPVDSNALFYIFADASLATDILVYGLKIEVGSSPTDYLRPECHLRIANKPAVSSWATEGLSVTAASQLASIIRNQQVTVSGFTAHIAFQYLGNNLASQYHLMHATSNSNVWIKCDANTGAISEGNFQYKSGNRLGPRGTDIADGEWHITSIRYDGTTSAMFVDGCLQESAVQSPSGTFDSFQFNPLGYASTAFQGTASLGAIGKWAYLAWYDAAHDYEDFHAMIAHINGVLVSRGITRNRLSYVVFEGDSITEGKTYTPLFPYCDRSVPNLTGSVVAGVNAVSGSSISHLTSRADTVDASLLSSLYDTGILCVMIGTNDLSGGTTAAQYLTNLKAYCAARKAAGWLVVVSTIPPRNDVTFNGKRATANAEINNAVNIGVSWDAVASWDADVTIGVDAAASNATYYPDGVHPSNVAHILIEPYVTAAINSLL